MILPGDSGPIGKPVRVNRVTKKIRQPETKSESFLSHHKTEQHEHLIIRGGGRENIYNVSRWREEGEEKGSLL